MSTAVIRFHCPVCDAKYSAPESAVGRVAACKGCGAKIAVPPVAECSPNPEDPGALYGRARLIESSEAPTRIDPAATPAAAASTSASSPGASSSSVVASSAAPPKTASFASLPSFGTEACPHCGNEIFSGSAWCMNCGKSLIKVEKKSWRERFFKRRPKRDKSKYARQADPRDSVLTARTTRPALFISFLFPGLGHIYKREYIRAAIYAALAIGAIVGAQEDPRLYVALGALWFSGLLTSASVAESGGGQSVAVRQASGCLIYFWLGLAACLAIYGGIQVSRRTDEALKTGAGEEFFEKIEQKSGR